MTVCALCGCEEEAHGGELDVETGMQVCTGCGEVCDFEPEDEDVEEGE